MHLRPYAKLSGRLVETHLRRPERPFKLTFATTFWCNYKCKTCNIWKMAPKNELSLLEIQTFFKKNPYFLWVDLTGGEVWLRKDFVEVCMAVIDHCPDLLMLHFPTNGYLTDQIVAGTREIAARGIERLIITVSMDGDEAMNDSIRGIEGGWRRQIETFRQLHEIEGLKVVLGMTLCAENVDHFPQAFAAARAECPWLTYQDFHVNIVHASSHYFGNEDLNLREAVEPRKLIDAVNQYRALRGRPRGPVDFLEHEYLRRVEAYLKTGVTPTRCHALRSSCFIDSWGQVFPCTIYDHRLGSLREHDFDLGALWNSEEAIRVQQEIWNFQCPQCWTPCEAYQSILGNFFRPGSSPAPHAPPDAAKPSLPGTLPVVPKSDVMREV